MGYDVNLTIAYPKSAAEVMKACQDTAKDLGGKVIKVDQTAKTLKIQMDKKLQGKILGDRSLLDMSLTESAVGETTVKVLAYPLNAIGQKLFFGARPGVVQTVLKVFFETVEAKLGLS